MYISHEYDHNMLLLTKGNGMKIYKKTIITTTTKIVIFNKDKNKNKNNN